MHYYSAEIRCQTLVEYFQSYWVDYIAALIERGNIELCVESPRMLLHDILLEIQYNKFKNKDNIAYFQNQLREWYEKDRVLKSISGIDIQNALQHYFVEKHQRMLEEICQKILVDLDRNDYFDKLHGELLQYLETHQDLNDETKGVVRTYARLLIAEFVSKGYDLQDIQGVSHEIPGVAQLGKGMVVSAPDNFMELRRNQFPSDEAYYKAIADRIEKRSVVEIITPIRESYHREPDDVYILMGLSYIKGVSEVCIDGVIIYSPKVRKFVTGEYECPLEKETLYQKLCAAIPVKYYGMYSAIKEAKRKMDGVLEMLSIYYDSEKNIEYDLGEYFVVKDGVSIAESMSRSEKGMRKEDDLYIHARAMNMDIIRNDKDNITLLYQGLYNIHDKSTSERLKNALHWCRKANTALTDEEKLLHSWFALEGLLTVPDDIKECIAPNASGKVDEIKAIAVAILGQSIFRDKCLIAYSDMMWRLEHQKWIQIPEEIKHNAGLDLKIGDHYRFGDFVCNAEELSKHISDEMLKDRLKEVSQFYSSIDNYRKEIQCLKNNILNIYRYRNLIVHNAVVPKESTEYYARLIYHICRQIIIAMLRKCTDGNITIEQAMLQIMIDYQGYEALLPNEIQRIKQKCKV